MNNWSSIHLTRRYQIQSTMPYLVFDWEILSLIAYISTIEVIDLKILK